MRGTIVTIKSQPLKVFFYSKFFDSRGKQEKEAASDDTPPVLRIRSVFCWRPGRREDNL